MRKRLVVSRYFDREDNPGATDILMSVFRFNSTSMSGNAQLRLLLPFMYVVDPGKAFFHFGKSGLPICPSHLPAAAFPHRS